MNRIKLTSQEIQMRKVNGRTRYEKAVRKLNSVSELVGEQVELTEGDSSVTTEVEAVEVDKAGNTQLELVTGDKVELNQSETTELLEEGEVVSEPELEVTEEVTEEVIEDEPTEDFTVTREVVDGDEVRKVSTNVEAIDELDAEVKVKLLDSRRQRNTRNYNSRRVNSEPAAKPDAEVVEEVVETAPESKEFKVVRKVTANGKVVRKVASVIAPTLEEAIQAVETSDAKEEVKAEGYQELIETQPKPADVEEVSKVIINSDVEIAEAAEVAEEVAVVTEGTEGTEGIEEAIEGDESIDRESNSFKGVSEYVKRAYGLDI